MEYKNKITDRAKNINQTGSPGPKTCQESANSSQDHLKIFD